MQLVNGTPVLDIKPYIHHYDDPGEHATMAPWVEKAKRTRLCVTYEPEAEQQLQDIGELLVTYLVLS